MKTKFLLLTSLVSEKNHSSYMALMILIDKLTKSLENGDNVLGIFLDFSKAFDTVNHRILLLKLEYYGIRGAALSWLDSYLKNRKQFVTYNNVKSSMKHVNCGVPQGSILGPLLFLIYINDLESVCVNTFPILFADDTNIFMSGKDTRELEIKMNDELIAISKWLKVNKLSLNVKKTHYMIFSPKRILNQEINLQIEGYPINRVKSTKFLGVFIDEKLNWKSHISHVCGKISRGIGIILKGKNMLNRDALVTLYYSFIYPYYIYGNYVWGRANATTLKPLILIQKKCVRIICNVKPRYHTNELFKQLGFLKCSDIITI